VIQAAVAAQMKPSLFRQFTLRRFLVSCRHFGTN